VFDVYDVIHRKMQTCSKPIFAVMPSISTAGREVKEYRDKGHIVFYDEVVLGEAITKISNTPSPAEISSYEGKGMTKEVERILSGSLKGYLEEEKIQELLDLASIPRVRTLTASTIEELKVNMNEISYPLAMKVIGPLHKSDVGGVILNIDNNDQLESAFDKMRKIEGFEGVLVQPMVEGMELFLGATYEENFGHMIYCGLGGIFVEAIKDVKSGLVPLNFDEAMSMINSLKSVRILEGIRGQQGIDKGSFADIIVKLSELLRAAPMIKEMDLNPLIGKGYDIVAVDARIRI
jgi:acetyltransferase